MEMKKHCGPVSAYRAVPAKAVEIVAPFTSWIMCIISHIADHDLKGALSCRLPTVPPGWQE